ncbi:MAG TPA: hypothetical protein VGJ39_16715 [Vicinamibacterales bacterium]
MKTDSEPATPTWVFARGTDHVRIQRVEPTRLVVSSPNEDTMQHDFDSAEALLSYQLDYEQELVANGWRLIEFSPERRSGHDRRKVPRFGEDRRRRPKS